MASAQQNDALTQKPDWVENGRYVTYPLGATPEGIAVSIIARLPCDVEADLTGNYPGEVEATVTVRRCVGSDTASVGLAKIMVGEMPAIGNFSPDSVPALTLSVEAFVMLTDTAGVMRPLYRQDLPLEVFVYWTKNNQLVIAIPAPAESRFRWSQDQQDHFSIFFTETGRWGNQMFFLRE